MIAAIAVCAASAPAAGVKKALPFPRDIRMTGGFVKNPPVEEKRDASLPAEGYVLEVGDGGAKITAADDRGAFYARMTMRQLTTGEGVAKCRVKDWPEFPVRMIHIDEGRHFFGKRNMLETLEWMAYYKLNMVEWHLCEDQGWRIQIDKYPNLTTYGATRNRTVVPGRFTGKYDNRKYGPYFYTKDDVREILAKARELHIEIIPDIEVPGHTRSVLAAYPEFCCEGFPLDERACWSDWGVSDDVVCVGNDAVVKFFCDVIDELSELFPDARAINICGDECGVKHWKECPKCQARKKKEGLKSERQLQGWITDRLMDHLRRRGRKMMGYSPIVSTGSHLTPEDCYIICGCMDSPAAYAMKGFKVIQSPLEYCYWEFSQGIPGDTRQYDGFWAGSVPLGAVYSYDPRWTVPGEYHRNIIGAAGCMWSEQITDREDFQWKLWPRAIALAQQLWHPLPSGGYGYDAIFLPALRPHVELMRRSGINVAGWDETVKRTSGEGYDYKGQILQ
ncbi:MAG: family 20 glycosylhydrolase [Kiritimatiellae bacterium]|nr:family 20 glycosylhydrolase [Kiritimatiellia bacterium]